MQPLSIPDYQAMKKQESEQWLRGWCNSNDCPSYETVMQAITTGNIDRDEYDDYRGFSWEDYGDGPILHFNGIDAHSSIPDEFWDHIEVVTGTKFGKGERAVGFSCSC